jgi:hypothetical protein
VADLHVLIYTDPACPWSRAAEPGLRHIQTMFGDGREITYVMGGLARTFARLRRAMRWWPRAGSPQRRDGRSRR